MQTNDNLDDLLRKKADEFDLPYSDEYWNEAGGMVEKELFLKRRALLKRSIWFSGSAAVILITGIALYLNIFSDTEPGMQQQVSFSHKQFAVTASSQGGELEQRKHEDPVVQTTVSESQSGEISSGNTSLPVSENNSVVALKKIDDDKTWIQPAVSTLKKPESEKRNMVATNTPKRVSEPEKPSAPERSTARNISADRNPAEISSASLVPVSTIPVATAPGSEANREKTPDEKYVISQVSSDQKITSATVQEDATAEVLPDVPIAPVSPPATPPAAVQPPVALTRPVAGICAGVSAYTPFRGNKNMMMPVRNNPSVMADPFAGVTIGWNISSRIGINAAGIFIIRRGINYSAYSESVQYDFGRKIEVYRVETEKMYLLELPVAASFALAKRHHVTAGGGLSYLLNTVSDVKKYDQPAPSGNKEKGYREGYAPVSYFLTVGYQFFFTHRFRFLLSYQAGLSDLSNDQYFNLVEKNKNSTLRLGIIGTINGGR